LYLPILDGSVATKSKYLVFCLGLIISFIFAVTDSKVVYALSGKAYITNFDSNTVSVIDTSSDTVIATIPVGTGPFGVAVNELKKRVYVSNNYGNTISVIDTDSYK
jgi:YVTN family beta-propeller protein